MADEKSYATTDHIDRDSSHTKLNKLIEIEPEGVVTLEMHRGLNDSIFYAKR